MKLSIATLALTLTTASVQGSMLRINKQAVNNIEGTIIDTEVFLDSKGEPTQEDMAFIGKALVASYNNVHWEAGYYMKGEHDVTFGMCNNCIDDDSMGDTTLNAFSVKTTVGGMCNNCRDDDSTGSFESLLTSDATAELEVNFCNKIESAGSKYLNSAKSCSIKFDADAKNTQQVALKANASNNVATIDNTLILKGVAGDATSKEDLAIIAKAFVSAYNDVHWDANHYLADAEIPFSAGSPDGGMCNNCIDDDSNMDAMTKTLVLDIVTPVVGGMCNNCIDDGSFNVVHGLLVDDDSNMDAMTKTLVLDIVTPVIGGMCNNCIDDDSIGFNMATLKSSKFSKKMVEVAFCKKLQNSVSTELSVTKSCSIAVESIFQSADTAVTKAY